jgi:twitching motility protein PilU
MDDGTVEIDPSPALRALLEHMGKIEASDLYLAAGHPAVFRVENVTYAGRAPFDAAEIASMADSLMSPTQRQEFLTTFDMNLTFALGDGVRFRANLLWQRGAPGMVVRSLRTQVKTLAELGHVPTLEKVALARKGLVLVAGDHGSGRSTTLAAMIDHRNANQTGHILTIEDPIEFVHARKQCVVTQREVGVDTRSFAAALSNASRQTPDLIFIGEIRDAETMETLLSLAGGRLCFSTLHASNAKEAVDRVLSFFPPERHSEIRMRLSQDLRAVIAQRLVPALQPGRMAAVEILLDTPRVKELIRRGELEALEQALEQGSGAGCCTFDSALFALFSSGRIAQDQALEAADRPAELLVRMQRLQDPGRAAEAPLRLAADPYEPPVAVAEPSADRRSKVGPMR